MIIEIYHQSSTAMRVWWQRHAMLNVLGSRIRKNLPF